MELNSEEIEKTLVYVLDLVYCIRPFEEVIWNEEILAQASFYTLVLLSYLSKMNLSSQEFNLLPPIIVSLLGGDPDSEDFLDINDEIINLYQKLLKIEEKELEDGKKCPLQKLVDSVQPLKELLEEPVIRCAVNHAIEQVVETEILNIYQNDLKQVTTIPGLYPGCGIVIHDESGQDVTMNYLTTVTREGRIFLLLYEEDPDEVSVFNLVIDTLGNMSLDQADDETGERIVRSLE